MTRVRVWATVILGAMPVACGGAADPVAEGFEQLRADNVMISAQTRYTSNGILSAEAQFDTVYVFDDSASRHVKGVRVGLFDESGRRTGTLTSDSGRMNDNSREMVALGNVVLIVIEDGRRIETEELHYDPQERSIWSDVHTVQTLNGDVTEGLGGFRADDQFRNVQIVRPRGRLPGQRIRF